jgi:DNA repair protein RecN (Recombination protein N)
MLRSLSIRDVVLIDRLDIGFEPGLCVLTGETGSGKSILLDALGLAIGMRADSDLVRRDAERTSVTAEFDVAPDHPAMAMLAGQGLDGGEGLVLRRTIGADGRSRAFINDQAVGVALLRAVGETLIEVQGQFESHGLLDPSTHRGFIDAFGDLDKPRAATRAAHAMWREARAAREQAERDMAEARRDEEFLRHALDELATLDPKEGEEASLAAERRMLQSAEKIGDAINEAVSALSDPADVGSALHAADRALRRVADVSGGKLGAVLEALERAAIELAEARDGIEAAATGLDADPAVLDRLEERLFALRAAARKHDCAVDELPALRTAFECKLAGIEDGGANLKALATAEQAARAGYEKAAKALSKARGEAAGKFDAAVAAELPALNLAQVRFATGIERQGGEDSWGPEGWDAIAFNVCTNPGAAAGPLHRVASGGELARIMLALKVVLAEADPVPTIVFDEVDAGIGGAAAAAVGERLARLAEKLQVLVVTHSPQVAARGAFHWRVTKGTAGTGTRTAVDALDRPDRLEEIARMLAGRKVTEEARAAARSLLEGGEVTEFHP